MSSTQKKGGGSRKLGRNKKWCESYRLRMQSEKNKKSKMERHIKRFPADDQAINAIRSIADKRLNALRAG